MSERRRAPRDLRLRQKGGALLKRAPAVTLVTGHTDAKCPSTHDTILRTLSDAHAVNDPIQRSKLALSVPSWTPNLTVAGRKTLVDALISGLNATDTVTHEELRRGIRGHVVAETALVDELTRDTRLPLEFRLDLLRLAPLGTIVQFAKAVGPDARQLATFTAFARYISDPDIASELAVAVLIDDARWREFLNTPEFADNDYLAMIDVLSDPRRSPFIRNLAQSFASYAATHGSEVTREDLLRRTLNAWRTTDPEETHSFDTLSKMTATLTKTCLSAPEVWELVIPAISDDNIPALGRDAIIRALPVTIFSERPSEVWSIARRTEDRSVRAAFLMRLIEAKAFGEESAVRQLAVSLIFADTPDQIAKAEYAWNRLESLGDVFSGEGRKLVEIAIDPKESPIVQETALAQLTRRAKWRRLTATELRRLWLYVTSEPGARVWEDTRASQALPSVLAESVQSAALRAVIAEGPRNPLWNTLVKLATLPDQTLAHAAMRVIDTQPEESRFLHWSTRVPSIPGAALLPVYQFVNRADNPEDLSFKLNLAFQAALSHKSEHAELLHTAIMSTTRPPNIAARITHVLNQCRFGPNDRPEALTSLLRYAQLEAQLAARDSDDHSSEMFDAEPDLTPGQAATLLPIARDQSASELTQALRSAIVERLLAHLPSLPADQLSQVLATTPAPAILARHYLKVNRDGLPLLAEAIAMASDGTEKWNDWRFERPQARAQVSYLDDTAIKRWRENLSVPVGISVIPDDVRDAASRIRERFQRALQHNEISEEYRELLHSQKQTPAELIRRYQTLIEQAIGTALSRKVGQLDDDLLDGLPERTRKALVEATSTGNRENLMRLRYRFERAVDLLRLLYCDEKALARNELRAPGENAATVHGKRARAHFEKMKFAFQNGALRKERDTPLTGSRNTEDSAVLPALSDAQEILDRVMNFVSTKEFVAEECTDFRTLIEIGHRPYGQGSCQNYANSSDLNRALLGYVVDAMTKVVVIRTAPTPENPEGTPIARAVIRVGQNGEGDPVLIAERAYATGGETLLYEPMVYEAVQAFAAKRGWLAAKPIRLAGVKTAPRDIVSIPGSQNGFQYEDGAHLEGMREGPYALEVTYQF